jgi:uncharacterized protein (TIGR03067 family)
MPLRKVCVTRFALALCVALALTCHFHAALADDDAAKQELARFAGVWKFVRVAVDGKDQPETGHETDRLVLQKDGRFAVVQRRISHGTITADPTKTPKQYDIFITDGPAKGLKVLGLYEISGDTMTLCTPLRGTERPTALVSKPGDGYLFQVLKRENQDVKDALIAAGRRELTGTWQAVSYALDGKKASEEDMKKVQLVFDAEGKTQALNDGKVFLASTTTIDPTANPATIDITFSGGEGKGGTALGLYKVEDRVLTICRAAPGKARPTEFSSNPGGGLTLMSYKHKPATPRNFRTGPGALRSGS